MKIIDCKGARGDSQIGIVVSRFNEEFTQPLLEGALNRLGECDVSADNITVVWVPGAVEIPIVAQRLTQLGTFDAIVCLGVIIRGETGHYDFVCKQVSDGCQHVALQNDIPVIFGVLTTENETQTRDRLGGAHGHKGVEAVDAALEVIATLRQIG